MKHSDFNLLNKIEKFCSVPVVNQQKSHILSIILTNFRYRLKRKSKFYFVVLTLTVNAHICAYT